MEVYFAGCIYDAIYTDYSAVQYIALLQNVYFLVHFISYSAVNDSIGHFIILKWSPPEAKQSWGSSSQFDLTYLGHRVNWGPGLGKKV